MEIMVYLILIPALVIGCLILAYPFVLRAKQRKLEENNRIVQQILDEYAKEVELRTKFDMAYRDRRTVRKVINVDFVEHAPAKSDVTGWKLVYNEELGVYQKVPR
tara:strand:- start:8 stop:322 length:315 start_codon:yes stop_codon:yes gene_type:complete